MAKYSGILKFTGKLDSFVYVNGISPYVRCWDSGRSKRMKTDARFKNVRLVQSDFGLASSIGKKIRNALEPLTRQQGDATLSARLTGALFGVINKDVHPKGERECDLKNFGKNLRSFEFNKKNNPLNKHLEWDYEIVNNEVRLSHLNLKNSRVNAILNLTFLLVPEVIGRADSSTFIAQINAFTLEKNQTIFMPDLTNRVVMIFLSLHLKHDGVNHYRGMQLLDVFG